MCGARIEIVTSTEGFTRHFIESYLKQLQQGTKPPLAKLTLARRIAATVLAMWKSKEKYDPDKYRK